MLVTRIAFARAFGVGLMAGALTWAAPLAAQTAQIALGDTISVETLAMVVALERAKEKGFDYKLTSFAKEDSAIQAVIGGQAEIGIATPYAVMQKTKAPLRGLMQLTSSSFSPSPTSRSSPGKIWTDSPSPSTPAAAVPRRSATSWPSATTSASASATTSPARRTASSPC